MAQLQGILMRRNSPACPHFADKRILIERKMKNLCKIAKKSLQASQR
jgi:hypothetical protein